MSDKNDKLNDFRAKTGRKETTSEAKPREDAKVVPNPIGGDGKLRKQTSHRNEMQLVKPMGSLSRTGELYFNAVASFLERTEVLQVVDSMMLTMLAQNIEKWSYAHDKIAELGPEAYLETNPNGLTHQSGLAQMLEKAEKSILSISTRLGLSPADRAKLWSNIENARNAAQANSKDELDNF